MLAIQGLQTIHSAYEYYYCQYRSPSIHKHTSILSGELWMEEMIGNSNTTPFYENMGMNDSKFFRLKEVLELHSCLCPGRWITSNEKLWIFLYFLVTGNSNRIIQERFQRSTDTISRVVTDLINKISSNMELINKLISFPTVNPPNPEEISSNPNFFPNFKDCIGAVDGTHLIVHVNDQDKRR